MGTMLCLAIIAVAFAAAFAGDTAYCTYKQDDVVAPGSGGLGGYYARNPPQACFARHIGNWRPTYRVKKVADRSESNWKEYEGACYYNLRGHGHHNYKDAEQWCNNHGGRLYVPNDQEEQMFVISNVMHQNDWYWTGIWCTSVPDSHNGADFYTVSGEDMRIINKKLQLRSHHPIRQNGNEVCMMTRKEDPNYWFQFHHQNCNEGRGAVCETPLQ